MFYLPCFVEGLQGRFYPCMHFSALNLCDWFSFHFFKFVTIHFGIYSRERQAGKKIWIGKFENIANGTFKLVMLNLRSHVKEV